MVACPAINSIYWPGVAVICWLNDLNWRSGLHYEPFSSLICLALLWMKVKPFFVSASFAPYWLAWNITREMKPPKKIKEKKMDSENFPFSGFFIKKNLIWRIYSLEQKNLLWAGCQSTFVVFFRKNKYNVQ